MTDSKIKNRKVFYVSGFDPRGDKFYYRMYRQELSTFSKKSQQDIKISKLKKESEIESLWEVENKTLDIKTSYSFLGWQDVVQNNWIKNPFLLIAFSFIAYYRYIRFMDWQKLTKLAKSPLFTLFYPLAVLVFLFLVIFASISIATGDASLFNKSVLIIFCTFLFYSIIQKIKTIWLLRFFIFNSNSFNSEKTDVRARVAKFASVIKKELEENAYDEIALICHSNGTILISPLLSELSKICDESLINKITILSLGQCIPLISCNKKAKLYKDDLKKAAKFGCKWVDLSYPADGAAYAKTNPLYPIDQELEEVNLQFDLHSPRFYKYFSPQRYKKLKRNKFDLHFQYLKNTDKPSKYNYLFLTTNNHKIVDNVISDFDDYNNQ
jgi:hypothetical protein